VPSRSISSAACANGGKDIMLFRYAWQPTTRTS
jgi:hypothetical protein